MTENTETSETTASEAKKPQTSQGDTPESKPKRAPQKRKSASPRKPQVQAKKGVGFFTVFVMMALAAIGGAVLSQVYERMFVPAAQFVSVSEFEGLKARVEALPEPETVDIAPLSARIAALEAASTPHSESAPSIGIPPDLEDRIAKLEAKPEPDFTQIELRLSELEARPALETSSDSEPPIEPEFLSRLEALEDQDLYKTLEARLSALENAEPGSIENDPDVLLRLEGLEKSIEDVPEPVDLGDIETRLAALETQAQSLKSTQETVLKATAPIPPFPSEAVLSALASSEKQSEKGWFGKTFDKLVLADNAQAIQTVSRIESLLQQGRVDMALEQVASLPASGQEAAKEWTDIVKARKL